MKTQISITVTLIVILNFIVTIPVVYSQDSEKPEKNESRIAFEQALKNHETRKQKEEEELAKQLHISLNKEVDAWLVSAKKDKESLLGSRIKQNWEKLALVFSIAPAHQEYALKGYQYTIIKSDVNRTDSISSPYKADVIIKEELYVEKNHSPGISDTSPYFYTVTTSYNLHLIYKQEKFELISSDNKIVNIENKVPPKIIKPGLW